MHHAHRGGPRARFLKEVSNAILQYSGARRLDLWVEDEDWSYHWQAVSRNGSAIKTRMSDLKYTGEKSSPQNPGNAKNHLIKRALSLIRVDKQSVVETDHTVNHAVWVGDAVLMPFMIDGQNKGVLTLTSPEYDPEDPTGNKAFEDLARFLGVAISIRRAKAALLERVKELSCMYRIAHIAAETDSHMDDILQEVVALLPPALQFPEIATARITLGEKSFFSAGFKEGSHHLSANLSARGTKVGEVKVYYTETPPAILDERNTPIEETFLKEEHHLINGVAREINSIIEQKNAEEEKQHLQAQVRHADRLVTIGELAAGVAHELNEPLGNILGFAQLAMKSDDLTGQARRDIEKIEKASLYAREVIRKLMFFAHQTPSRKTLVELNTVVEDSLLLVEARCKKAGIEVVRRLEHSLPGIAGDSSQLQQVLVNLVVNAIQAMPDGGRLTITTSQGEDKQTITVEDTGRGIDQDNLKRIFLPFFTTKEVGEGTGLGLSVAYGIVNSHGGSIDVESEIDTGTRFIVQFPAIVHTTQDELPDDK